MKQLILLDRDGTLIHEPPSDYQVDSLEKLSLLPGVIRNLYQLQQEIEAEWVMITNQDGLGTESFPEDTFWPAHQMMMDLFENEGITFNEVLIDRTFKREGAPTRKPGTGLLTHYMTGAYDLQRAVVIGDRLSDIQLAKNLGGKGILLGKSLDLQDDDVDLAALEPTFLGKVNTWDEIRPLLFTHFNGRKATLTRQTHETDIRVAIDLDGTGQYEVETGIGFFDHMLAQLAKHSRVDMNIAVKGDLHIDPHHTIEDTALALGMAFKAAMGDKRGMERYGSAHVPMDEASVQVALDFSGRPWFVSHGNIPREKVGAFPVEMTNHFFQSFSQTSGCTLHLHLMGENAHHMIEIAFKGVARAIRAAIKVDQTRTDIPSTKGIL